MGQWSHLYNDRAWQRLRKAQLQREPLCERCKERGLIVEATICDHIDSHHGDLTKFWAGPFSSLCKQCHDVKTVTEDAGLHRGAATHPDWLPLPACPVVLVTGSPGSGKTTYCKAHAKRADVVIDLDDCFTEVCGTHGHTAERQHLPAALRLRNKRLADLSRKREGKAYVIVGCPSTEERDWWVSRLNATPILIEATEPDCLDRVAKHRREAVQLWHRQARLNEWKRPQRRVTTGEDGDRPVGAFDSYGRGRPLPRT